MLQKNQDRFTGSSPLVMLSQEEAGEFIRCAGDPRYFIEEYCCLIDPVRGVLPFTLFPFQKYALSSITKSRYSVVKKPRQMGLSNLVAAIALWIALFHSYKNTLVVSIKDTVAQRFLDKVKTMYKNLPDFFRRTVEVVNGDPNECGTQSLMVFNNGSRVMSVPASKNAGRSEALSCLILDEAAFIDHIEDIWAAAQPTLSTGGMCIMLSTVFGIGNHFHKTWVEAKSNTNGFNPIELSYDMYPGRDDIWLSEQLKTLGKKLFLREVLCQFETTGDTFFPAQVIAGMQRDIEEARELQMSLKPLRRIFIDDYEYQQSLWSMTSNRRSPVLLSETVIKDEDLFVWEYPNSKETYSLGADVAEATSAEHDHQAFYIVKDSTGEIVVEYLGKIPINEYATLLYLMSNYYNECAILIERNSVGVGLIELLQERGLPYERFYTQLRHERKKTDKTLKDKDSEVIGFQTNRITKPIILNNLLSEYEANTFWIRSIRSICQHQVFVRKDGKLQALPTYSDDLVMAAALTRECLRNKQNTGRLGIHPRG